MKKAGIAYFTEQGGRLAHRIADGLAPEYEILLYEKGLKDWCAACFAKAELIIFIGACGIAVRTIAPLLKSKTEDPAVLVLDEAVAACNHGLIEETALLDFLRRRPEALEVVLTGRDPSQHLLDAADYVTEMRKRKHPFDRGIAARRGVEF